MQEEYRLQLRNQVSEIERIGRQLDAIGRIHGLGKSMIYGANLSIEELFTNILAHAYEDREEEHVIDIRFSVIDRKLTITLADDGKEFNPNSIPLHPTGNLTLEDIEDIELGLRLVRMLVDIISYERTDGRNVVTLVFEDIPDRKTILSVMDEKRIFPPPEGFRNKARIQSLEQYNRMYRHSIDDPESFWAEMAEELEWYRKWDRVFVENFEEGRHEWFTGGKLNLTVNCLDRHLQTGRKNKAALIWEGDKPGENRILTYQQLHREVCRFANVLRKHGIQKGDRVSIYLPMIPELPIAMLSCARIGAIHSVVFGGFSSQALGDRIRDCESRLLVCANGYTRGGKRVRSKEQADRALDKCPGVTDVIVIRRVDIDSPMQDGRDCWWEDEIGAPDISSQCEPEVMDAEDPLFILYTSGSTGKPKGVLHTTAGYLVYVMQTFKYIFDIREDDTWWCTADIGWITGHSYIVYGPLANGATSLMFEGVPGYPGPDRFWNIVEKYRVSIFYTAPTALRALMKEGNDWPAMHDLASLRLLGSVGEPINPKVWMWYWEIIGRKKCPIVDTWWQTETGGIVISPLPGATPCKPGSATLPFFGIQPEIIRSNLDQTTLDEGGWLVIKKPWPGLMRRVYGDPGRFKKTYFDQFPGVYTTGDGARTDQDGYYWIMGRIDDVINVSGHRLGTAELESVLVSHGAVAEAAVVGMPHESKGQGIYAFVTLKADEEESDDLIAALKQQVRNIVGPIATPDRIQFAEALPKTRSGKIVRRILTKIAAGDVSNLGDTSTLVDESMIDNLIRGRNGQMG